jgi:hypothetical protein
VNLCSPAMYGVIFLFTDALFHSNSAHNALYWSLYSMSGTTVRNCNSKLSSNIWCVIVVNTLIGRRICEGDLRKNVSKIFCKVHRFYFASSSVVSRYHSDFDRLHIDGVCVVHLSSPTMW